MGKTEKFGIQLTYLGGVTCLLVAIVWRGLNFLGIGVRPVVPGQDLYYMSFFKGALILLLASIAASSYASYRSRQT